MPSQKLPTPSTKIKKAPIFQKTYVTLSGPSGLPHSITSHPLPSNPVPLATLVMYPLIILKSFKRKRYQEVVNLCQAFSQTIRSMTPVSPPFSVIT
jgi:hypothetical protein